MPEVSILVYGREGCNRCAAAGKKIGFFLGEWGLGDRAEMVYLDMGTEEGMAESAFADVMNIPAILVMAEGEVVSRWDGRLPESGELRACIEGVLGQEGE